MYPDLPRPDASWHTLLSVKPFRGACLALSRLDPLILCLRRRRMTHLSSQLLAVSDCQLTIGEHVTDIAVSQLSQRTRLSEKLLQGASCVHGECTMRVWLWSVAFREQIGSRISL